MQDGPRVPARARCHGPLRRKRNYKTKPHMRRPDLDLGRISMRRTSPLSCVRITRRSFAAGAGAAGLLAATGTANVARAQSGPLKVGVLLPRSGAQAGSRQDCQRGGALPPAPFQPLPLPELGTIIADPRTKPGVPPPPPETPLHHARPLL